MSDTIELSLYIHVPFCRGRCAYCDFYSTIYEERAADSYIEALIREWELVRRYRLDDMSVRIATVYIGGGTPSALSVPQWQRLAQGLLASLVLRDNAEVSIECNPESFSSQKARAWLDAGVNRITVGVQSLQDEQLVMLGRRHRGARALEVLQHPLLQSFTSVGADLMYALPGRSEARVRKEVARLCALPVLSHLSAYELTLHPGTPLYEKSARLLLPSEDRCAVLYDAVEETARAHGFVHYEVSNYARADRDEGDGDKPHIGFNTVSENSPETRGCGATDEYTDARSRHNMRYWQQQPYIGLGPAAHSYLHPYRYATAASLRRYCEALDRKESPPCTTQRLDTRQCALEMLMQGLRCDRGVDEQAFARLCGEALYAGRRRAVIDTLCTQGYLFRAHGRLIPTRAGMRCADALALQLW